MLVSAKEMLDKAVEGHYAVGQFNINNLEWTKSILLTAEELKSPVILGVSEGAGKYMTGFKTVAAMVKAMMEELNITVPVALHLDHGTYEGCKKCIDAGFSSIMFDGSKYPIEENVEKTRELIAICREKGMSIEAEVGSIWMPGKSPICAELEKSSASDCYYVEALTGCKPLSEQAGVTAVTEEEMKAADMIAKLNANLSANAWGVGADGFPALLWEIDGTGSIESVGATAGIEIVKEGDRLVIVSATGEKARLSVYDITGKMIVTAVVTDGDCITVHDKGVCIASLVTDDGNRTTHKFLF